MWRTTKDISMEIEATWADVVENLDETAGLARFAGPGGWNDADMLEACTPPPAFTTASKINRWVNLAHACLISMCCPPSRCALPHCCYWHSNFFKFVRTDGVCVAQVGSPGGSKLTYTEQRSHFALWAVIKSPLIIGADLRCIPINHDASQHSTVGTTLCS